MQRSGYEFIESLDAPVDLHSARTFRSLMKEPIQSWVGTSTIAKAADADSVGPPSAHPLLLAKKPGPDRPVADNQIVVQSPQHCGAHDTRREFVRVRLHRHRFLKDRHGL